MKLHRATSRAVARIKAKAAELPRLPKEEGARARAKARVQLTVRAKARDKIRLIPGLVRTNTAIRARAVQSNFKTNSPRPKPRSKGRRQRVRSRTRHPAATKTRAKRRKPE